MLFKCVKLNVADVVEGYEIHPASRPGVRIKGLPIVMPSLQLFAPLFWAHGFGRTVNCRPVHDDSSIAA